MAQYFEEIKNRLFLLLITFIFTFITVYCYKEVLLFIVTQFSTFKTGSSNLFSSYLIFTNVTEIFSVYFQLITFISFQVLLLYLIYHSFLFISPALYYKEYAYTILASKTVILIWFFSILLNSYVLVPLTLNFFLSFQESYSLTLHFEAKLSEYLNFYISFYYVCILYFQVFTVLFLFLSRQNLTIENIKKFRKLYYYFFVIFSTIISPPDIFSQLFLSSSMIVAYEFLLFILLLRPLIR